jgi:pimeloyl-[acyl-carrier protein] methyl ester esterase
MNLPDADSTENSLKRELKISGDGEPLVLLHGWSMNSAVWQPLQQRLESCWQIHNINLPGHGGRDYRIQNALFDDWLADIMALAPAEAVWLGWSMGGLFALAAAARFPERVKRLVLVATTPKFVASGDWLSAGEPAVWQRFEKDLQEDQHGTNAQFLRMQALGTRKPLQFSRQLEALQMRGGGANEKALLDGLRILQTGDLRSELRQISCSVQWLLSDTDQLIPVGVKEGIQALNPLSDIHIVPSAGHALFVSQPDYFLQIINGGE